MPSSQVPLSEELLAHSQRLLDKQLNIDNPNPAELRRAISAAYYSAWHSVCDAIARRFHTDLHPKLNRQPAHTGAKIAASTLLANKSLWQSSDCTEDMAQFCQSFLTLQNLRLKADYDVEFDVRSSYAVDAYNRSSRIGKFISEKSGRCPNFDAFVLQCLEVKFKNRGA